MLNKIYISGVMAVIFIIGDSVYAQQKVDPTDSALYQGNNTQLNDSTKLYILKDYGNKRFAKKSDQRKYDNLLRIVKKVYPLAKLAGQRMEEYAAAVDTLRKGQVEDFVLQATICF